MKKLIFVLSLGLMMVWLNNANAQMVDSRSLIEEMVALERLASFPDPGYSTLQFSSYDRRSQYPSYPGWFANSDGFGGEPVPGFLEVIKKPNGEGVGEYLICDVKGPGAIVRLWTAWIEGEVILWLDGKREPVYEGPAQRFFQRTYEAMLGVENKELWTGTLAQNTAGYYPIPFETGCRMVWRGKLNTLHFYHVQVRMYPARTRVKTFSIQDIRDHESRLDEVASILKFPSSKLDGELKDSREAVVWLKPGEKKRLVRSAGQGAFSRLEMEVKARDHSLALRQTLMEIRFDGAPWGQVHSPVGDFFGAAPGINPYESLPFTVFHNGRMVCRYFMPWRDSVEIMVENMGDQEVTVSARTVQVAHQWREGVSMHFRARWRMDHGLLADPKQVHDIPYLLIRGKGRMVGAAAYLMNPTFVPSSFGNWWGEGDEKIYIDDDLKPAFIGTGSEDYFNYAWSSGELFDHAYCGQPRNDGPDNRGFVTNYRWHILDNIAFEKSFDFFMELYSHRVVPGFSYGRMIYVYALREAHDDHMVITREDVRELKLPERWWPEADGWAHNAIFYQVEDLLSGHFTVELESSYLWSDGEMVVWTPKAPGERLDLDVPVTEDGKYMIAVTLARRPGDGQIKVLLDGKVIPMEGAEIHDLSTGYQPVSRNLKSGDLDLKEGLHRLSIEAIGDPVKPVGLDFIWVKRK